ncbi:uncharacterized protein LOC120424204 [Culex pipiens pallens]|uniref:uncharacterized protein LOC120424204 n=1 Tax=Culex pipiens pallens TaxID=42434 RepID=UPI0022AA6B0E|nr:uncharacterized protein LOC120424204 [Culex pipiens pallens]XP_052565481.1 uncharacterized protein LOC120424204 [Culex pipiens pallens]
MPGMTTPVKAKQPPKNSKTAERISGIHNGIRGTEYQLCVTMYILLRAYNSYSEHGQDFKLCMEPTDPIVGEFDDIWLEMNGEHILIQVKHCSDGSNLTEGMLLPNNRSSDEAFSMYKYYDSFEKSQKLKKARCRTDEKWTYVFLTNKPLQVRARKMFVKCSKKSSIESIFDTSLFYKFWNDQENECVKKLNPSDDFCDNFILSVAHLNLHKLRKKIEAEIRKTKQMDSKLGIKFLRDELFDWVCDKENRKNKYMDREWVESMFQKFHIEHAKDHWKAYENPVLSTIKESLQEFLNQDNQIGAIDETAKLLYEKIKYILTTGQTENTQKCDENKLTAIDREDDVDQDVPEKLSTIKQIFTLRQILQISREFQATDTHHLFIYFKVDYETAKLNELMDLIDANDSSTKTLGKNNSSVMLNLAVQCVLKRAEFNMEGTVFENSQLILCHDNEVDIIGKTIQDVEIQYVRLRAEARKVGLILDASKTKYMLANGKLPQSGSVTIASDKIEMVKEVEFLGSLVTWENSCNIEIERCIKVGKRTFEDLEEMLESEQDILKKWRIYDEQIRSRVLEGCETWTVLASRETMLVKFEDDMLRAIFNGAKQPDICRPIMSVVNAKQVRWAGQVAGMSNDEPAKRVVIVASFPDVNQRRRTGKPKTRWFEAINGREKGQDLREAWELAVKQLKSGNSGVTKTECKHFGIMS